MTTCLEALKEPVCGFASPTVVICIDEKDVHFALWISSAVSGTELMEILALSFPSLF